MTNYIQTNIDNRQQKIYFRGYSEKDETINHMSKCNNLSQKVNKTKQGLVRRVILWYLCMKLKFDHNTESYIYQLESIVANESQPFSAILK